MGKDCALIEHIRTSVRVTAVCLSALQVEFTSTENPEHGEFIRRNHNG